MLYDALTGYTDQELDNIKQKAKKLGAKVIDRRRWWNRLFRKQPHKPIGVSFNVKTQKPELTKEDNHAKKRNPKK